MPLAEVERGVAARIRGVVTLMARVHIPKEAIIVQDASAGIWVSLERLPVVPDGLERGTIAHDLDKNERGARPAGRLLRRNIA